MFSADLDEPICINCGNDLACEGEAYCTECLEREGYPACPRCGADMVGTGVFAGNQGLLLCDSCNYLWWI